MASLKSMGENEAVVAEASSALGHILRLGIVEALAQREYTYTELATHLGYFPGLWYHLRTLQQAKLLDIRRLDRRRVVYRLSPTMLRTLASFLTSTAAEAERTAAGYEEGEPVEGLLEEEKEESPDVIKA